MSDYISREEVKKIIASKGAAWEAFARINALPAADVRPVVRGKWERTSRSLMACSVCGNCVVDDRISGLFFCHNCGAWMEETDE